MAEPLSGAAPIGHSGIEVLKGVTQAQFLGFLDQYAEADQDVADAVAARKDLRTKIKAKLGGKDELVAFDRVRKDIEMSGEARLKRDLSHARMMAWRNMPTGFQPTMDLGDNPDPNVVALNVHELKRIDSEGLDAGKGGRRRDTNPYTPGTEAFARWNNSWLRGQGEIAETPKPGAKASGQAKGTTAKTSDSNGAGPINDNGTAPPAARRGRPPGSRNKPREDAAQPGPADQVH